MGCLHQNKVVLISWDSHNKEPQAGWFKQQKRILSQFRRPETPNQDVTGLWPL